MSWQREVNLKAIALHRARQARALTNYKSEIFLFLNDNCVL